MNIFHMINGKKKHFNSLPYKKILDLTKLKAFADNKINVTQILKFALGRGVNIVGGRENGGYQHFPTMFSKGYVFTVI